MLKRINLFRILLALAAGWMLFFYVNYGARAWFFSDDYSFLERYQHSSYLSLGFDFENFGRPLTRNIYWYVGQQVFGKNAILFFYFNLLTIIGSSLVGYSILKKFVRPDLALMGAFAYFASQPVIHTYVWLSNSQHSIGHLIVLVYILFYLRASAKQLCFRDVGLLLSLYLLGLTANIFVGLVVGLPLFMLLFRPSLRRDPRHLLLCAATVAMFIFYWLSLRGSASGAYEVKLGLGTLRTNAEFYFGSVWVLALLVACCLYGAGVHLRRGALLASWFFLAALAFYVPFAFLVYQRYAQYIALSAVFFVWGALIHIETYLGNYAKRTALLIVVALLATDMVTLDYFRAHPWGSDQRAQVEQLNAFDRTQTKRDINYCFFTPAHKNSSGLAIWDIPPEWWFVGFGKAFTVFVNSTANYQYGDQPRACDVKFFIEADKLNRK